MANVVVSAIATFNGKALKKGQKDISAFDKSVKKLGRTFAATFGAYQLLNFSKKAVQAFMADEKAAKSLEQQLKNTGYQFSGPAVEMYIANLQKTTGVLDDQLRPAFQQLLTVTGSLTTSQDALNTALNVSAATGKSLTEVTSALSRGYAGNTTGLSRLGAGLSKTLLKTNDMNLIMGELNKKFAGQSAARLTTYAGKMDLLTAAAANAQEIIGKSLLDSLSALGDDNSIEGLTKNMEDFATATGDVIYGLGIVAKRIKELTTIPGLGSLFDVKNIPVIGAYLGGFQQIGKNAREANNSQFNTVGRPSPAEIAIQLKLLKGKKDELAILNKKNAIENKNVEELKKKFDLERIGLTAALAKATDEETKLRLRAQLAILDNNDALAKKILAEMEAAEALKKLAEQAKAAGLSITEFALVQVKSLINRINAQIEKINKEFGLPSTTTTSVPSGATSLPASYFQDLAVSLVGTTGYSGMNVAQIATERARESGNRSVDVNLSVSNPSGDRFAQLIAESIQVAGRSGYSTAPNGGLP
jgi:phage shock protein A